MNSRFVQEYQGKQEKKCPITLSKRVHKNNTKIKGCYTSHLPKMFMLYISSFMSWSNSKPVFAVPEPWRSLSLGTWKSDCLQPPDLEVPPLRRDDTRGRIVFRKYTNRPRNEAKQEPPERKGDLAAQVSSSLNIQEHHEHQAGAFCPDQTRWGVRWQPKYCTVGYHTRCAVTVGGH